MKLKSVLVDEILFGRTLTRISHEIIEKNASVNELCLIGIQTRGVPIAKRICERIYKIEQKMPAVGTIDITFYRDDLSRPTDRAPVINGSDIGFDVSGKNVILVDDVIYTGRTVRAALDAIMACGRPATVQLAAFVDRGHRELPIRADYVGKNIPTSKNEIIKVNVFETDGEDNVELYEK